MEIESPEALVQQGFNLIPEATLVGTSAFQAIEKRLLNYIQQNPAMQARPPRPYQLRYACLSILRRNNLLAHEPGTGKTYTAGLIIAGIYGNQLDKLRPGTIQIMAPRHILRRVWLNVELKKMGLSQYAEVISSERDIRLSKAPIWIYHYDLLKRQSEQGKIKKKPRALYKLIRHLRPPNLLIVDEIHRLRVGTDRTKAVSELRKATKRLVGLTGTPMDGWVEHLSSILAIVYRENSPVFPFTAQSFTRRFTRIQATSRDFVTGEEGKKTVKRRPAPGIAVDQVPHFHQNTKHLMHRLTFKDPEVSPHLIFPQMDHQVVTLPMDPDHRTFYEEVHRKVIKLIEHAISEMDQGKASRFKTRQNVLTHLNLLRSASNHPWEMDPAFGTFNRMDTAKVREVVRLCQQAQQQERKVIVFTNRIATGRALTECIRKAGIPVIRFYGEDPLAKPRKLTHDMRDERIEQFQEDPTLITLVGNLDLMAEGLTLVEASYVIHHDHDWRAVPWSQGNARVVRPGQSYNPVPVYDLLHDTSVDNYVHQEMMRKGRAAGAAIDKRFILESGEIDPIDVARQMLTV